MKKAIAFDIGNVLCYVKFENFLSKLSQILNISTGDAWHFLERTQKLHDLGITSLSDELSDHFKIRSEVTIKEILTEWKKTISPHQLMISFVKELIDKKVDVALLSNIGSDHSAIISEVLSEFVYSNTTKFFSCEVGARKPSLLFFKTFLDMYPKFSNAIYLDDRKENLDTASKFNFITIQFDIDKLSYEEINAKLHSIRIFLDIEE